MDTPALRQTEKTTQGRVHITTSMKFTKAAPKALKVTKPQICVKSAQRPLTDTKPHNAQKILMDTSPHKPTKATQRQ
jgi:hypothetical protein